MFRKMQDPWALTYSAKKTKDGKNSGIKVISSPESFLSFLRFPSSYSGGARVTEGRRDPGMKPYNMACRVAQEGFIPWERLYGCMR